MVGVDELEPGAADGVGKHLRLLFRTRLPYTLGFDVRVTRLRPPSELVAEATGELKGTGRWTLTSAAGHAAAEASAGESRAAGRSGGRAGGSGRAGMAQAHLATMNLDAQARTRSAQAG